MRRPHASPPETARSFETTGARRSAKADSPCLARARMVDFAATTAISRSAGVLHLKTANFHEEGPAAARSRRAPVRFFFKGPWPCLRWRTTEARPSFAVPALPVPTRNPGRRRTKRPLPPDIQAHPRAGEASASGRRLDPSRRRARKERELAMKTNTSERDFKLLVLLNLMKTSERGVVDRSIPVSDNGLFRWRIQIAPSDQPEFQNLVNITEKLPPNCMVLLPGRMSAMMVKDLLASDGQERFALFNNDGTTTNNREETVVIAVGTRESVSPNAEW